MAEQGWLALVGVALGSGATVKLFDIVYQEYKASRERKTQSLSAVDKSLEAILRAADELVGKLRSLAQQDFIPLRGANATGSADFASLKYLFVQFWSEVELLRFRGLPIDIAKTSRGQRIQEFLVCLESRGVRLIDRISQRAIGEAAQISGRTMNFVEFVKSCDSDSYTARWLKPLDDALLGLETTEQRQRLLQFYVVLHALIDTMDANHHVTRKRPAVPNKLNTKSRRDLKFRVFSVYLPFVKDQQKYIGPLNQRP